MLPFYDDKGKVFTPIITKQPVHVLIQTALHRIEGYIHVRPEHRLKDELDNSDSFLAVTDARIIDASGQVIVEAPFIIVHSNQIVWLVPQEDKPEA